MSRKLSAFVNRLLAEDSGQDQVEYALLTVVVGLAGTVAAPMITDAIQFVYGTWVGEANNLWESPNPAP